MQRPTAPPMLAPQSEQPGRQPASRARGRHRAPRRRSPRPSSRRRSSSRRASATAASARSSRAWTTARASSPSGVAHPDVESAIAAARGGGNALDRALARALRQRARRARSPTSASTPTTTADALARAVSARAFTTGSDIFFAQGEYQPGTRRRRSELLAHELAHVVAAARRADERPADRLAAGRRARGRGGGRPRVTSSAERRRAVGFAFLDARMRAAVEAAAATDPNPADPFRGLYISDEQALSLAARRPRPRTPTTRLADAAAPARARRARHRRARRSAPRPSCDPRYGRLYAYLHDDVTRRLASPRLVARPARRRRRRAAPTCSPASRARAPLRRRGAIRLLERRRHRPRSPTAPSRSPTGSPRSCSGSARRSTPPAAAACAAVPMPAARARAATTTVAELRALLARRDARCRSSSRAPTPPRSSRCAAERPLLLRRRARRCRRPSVMRRRRAVLRARGPAAVLRRARASSSRPSARSCCARSTSRAERHGPARAHARRRARARRPHRAARRGADADLRRAPRGVGGAHRRRRRRRRRREVPALDRRRSREAAEVASIAARARGEPTPRAGRPRPRRAPRLERRGSASSPRGSTPALPLGRPRAARPPARAAALDLGLPAPPRPRALRVGLRATVARTQGLKVLFAGESGHRQDDGRRRCSPRELGLDLFRVDLATVVSKYIGETEKNLDRIFDAAERLQRDPLLRRGRRAVRQALRGLATPTTATRTSRSPTCCRRWRATRAR